MKGFAGFAEARLFSRLTTSNGSCSSGAIALHEMVKAADQNGGSRVARAGQQAIILVVAGLHAKGPGGLSDK